jgi:D-serine deaminase-like pyridoxal phosphate-dependent protein
MRDPAPIITEAHDRVRGLYGSAIGHSKYDVVTPALVVDREVLLANLAYMESRLPGLHARLRGHVKNHKSPHIARLQLEHGAFGICAATIWEAIVMVRAGADDVLIANQLVDPHKRRAAALLAREAKVIVNVDDIGDAEALSAAAVEAGSTLGILVEVDTGMHRAGVDAPAEALMVALGRAVRLRGALLHGDGPREAPREAGGSDALLRRGRGSPRGERRPVSDPVRRRHGDGVLDGRKPADHGAPARVVCGHG